MVQFLHRNGTLGAQNGIGNTESDSSRTEWLTLDRRTVQFLHRNGTLREQNGTLGV
jgi:hypothetical protein